ncbi:MAG: endonuclease III [bacterium]
MELKAKAAAVNRRLEPVYTNLEPLIHYRNCYELTVAVILSAQTTDNQVNRVTPELFERFSGPRELAAADPKEVEEIIRSVGFYVNKTRHILGAAQKIVGDFGGEVPEAMDDLVGLPGIGRKSANVIRGFCFGKPAIIVDTHFMRVVRRIGLTEAKNPDTIERDIGGLLPEGKWTAFTMRINRHGRSLCTARKPDCPNCPVREVCSYYSSERGGDKPGIRKQPVFSKE